MGLKVNLYNIFKRDEKEDKKLKVYNSGIANDYPERIERLITNSVTAKQAANTMTAFIAGQGFGELDNFIVNQHKGLTLFDLTHRASSSLSRQRGIFFHVNYNMNCDITSIDVLPFSHCRIGKKDDNSHSGKIAVCENWTDPKKRKETKFIDTFNPKKKVVEAQIEAAKGIKNYKGQILFVSMDYNRIYPDATIDAVQEDCDSESQASIYKNRSLRKGFFGKTMVITKPLVDADPEDEKNYAEQTRGREQFKKTIQEFIGAENNEGILHFEMEFDETEGIEKSLLFKTIETNIDDKLFEYTESSCANNIRKAFNNLPPALIDAHDGALFGSSGEALYEMKRFYQDQTVLERKTMIQSIDRLMKNFKDFNGTLVHKPLIEEKDEQPNNEG